MGVSACVSVSACGARTGLFVIGAEDASADAGAPAVDASEAERAEDARAEADAVSEEAAAPPPCDSSGLAGILVAELGDANNRIDPLGFPTYAIDGCTLAYVSRPAQGPTYGPLLVRDLATQKDTLVAPASEEPRRPTMAGDVLAWEATVGGVSVVRVQYKGQTTTVAGPWDHAGEPHASSDVVAFTAWLTADDGGDTDVYRYGIENADVAAIATGPGQQRFATANQDNAAYADFSEDPTGAFAVDQYRASDIVVFNLGVHWVVRRHAPGAQGFPMLGEDLELTYVDYGTTHLEPQSSSFHVIKGVANDPSTDVDVTGALVHTDEPWVRPAATAGWIVWVDDTNGGGLFGRPFDLSRPATAALPGQTLVGPITGSVLSVVATHMGNTPLYSLAGVAR